MKDMFNIVEENKIIVTCSLKPVFIVGSSRAGTTWLQSILSAHPSLFTIPETKFFQYVLESKRKLTFEESYPQKRKNIPERISPRQLEISLDHLNDIGFIKLSGGIITVLRMMAEKEMLDPCTMLNIIMYNVGNHQEGNGKYWFEKTPRHIFYLEDIFKYFPTAMVICIHRDLVDQSYSGYKTFGFPVLAGLIDGYRSYQALNNYIVKNMDKGPQIKIVRYEDIRSHMQEKMDEIWDFLGISPVTLENGQNDLSRDKFESIYKNTGMINWQPKMDRKKANTNEEIEKEKLYWLSVLLGKGIEEHIRTREIHSSSFVFKCIPYCLLQIVSYVIFMLKVKIKGLFIKLTRRVDK